MTSELEREAVLSKGPDMAYEAIVCHYLCTLGGGEALLRCLLTSRNNGHISLKNQLNIPCVRACRFSYSSISLHIIIHAIQCLF